jgi:hypothetical protein
VAIHGYNDQQRRTQREKERKLVPCVHHNTTAYTPLFMYVGPATKGGVSGVLGGEGILCRRQKALLIELVLYLIVGGVFFFSCLGGNAMQMKASKGEENNRSKRLRLSKGIYGGGSDRRKDQVRVMA